MAVIQSGATTDQLTIDPTSKAARVTLYDANGVPVGPRITYDAATSAAVTPPATPSDVFTIFGSGTKTVRVTRIRLSTFQTTVGVNRWFLLKRSTANTAGTSAAVTRIPRDSNNAAATATVLQYTANPTTGSLVGTVRASSLLSPATTTAGNESLIWDFDDFQTHPIYLRGTGEGLCINFAGAALPGGMTFIASVTWTEE